MSVVRIIYLIYIQSAAECLSNVALLYNPVVPKRGSARRKGRISSKEKQLAIFAPFWPERWQTDFSLNRRACRIPRLPHDFENDRMLGPARAGEISVLERAMYLELDRREFDDPLTRKGFR
jgi:hypothetical protein